MNKKSENIQNKIIERVPHPGQYISKIPARIEHAKDI